jgi:glutathione S-transferase
LRRVPTLVLDDGEALIESAAILDYLDEEAGPTKRLVPEGGPARRRALKTTALATGLAEKAVSLFYERVLHSQASDRWVERCERQIADTLAVLEAERAARATPYWFGERIGHADIAVACALRFIREAHPALFDARRSPRLTAHGQVCEALPPFQEIALGFTPPS